MMRQSGEGPTSEPFEPLRYVDLKRATRLEPTPQSTLGGKLRQWWRGVAHNELSLRVQSVLPEIHVEGAVITAIDRGEMAGRLLRALALSGLLGWAVVFAMFSYINSLGPYPPLFAWPSFIIVFLVALIPLVVVAHLTTRRGRSIARNTLSLDTQRRAATIHWKRMYGEFTATGALDKLALGLYMVEIYEPEVPRHLRFKNPMTIAALPMETYNRVDRGWIAIALHGDLWMTLGIDRTPDALRKSLQPFHDAGLAIDEDPAITVRGFGVKTLVRPDRERFANRERGAK